MQVYWQIPLGTALIEAMEEMDLDENLRNQVIEKYKKAVEKEFENMNQNGRTNSNRYKL